MTALVDLLMGALGIATWQQKGRVAYPPLKHLRHKHSKHLHHRTFGAKHLRQKSFR